MYIQVEAGLPGGAQLIEPWDFGSLKIVVRAPDEEARRELVSQVATVDADGEHAWIQTDVLRALAAELAHDPRWEAGLRGMISYADGVGWLSPGRDSLRVHIR